MTFDVDVLGPSSLSVGLMIGAAAFAAIGLVLFIIASIVGAQSESWAVLILGMCIASLLFTVSISFYTVAQDDQVDTITAQITELPGVDSFVPTSEENSIPSCESGTAPTKTLVSIITDDGESVDGHLVVSEPKNGACTYELKLPTK